MENGTYREGYEVIDTRKIRLEQIGPEEFKQREILWGDNRRFGYAAVYSEIKNPIRGAESYAHMLYVLGKTPNVLKVGVREGKIWHKLFPNKLTLENCASFGAILEKEQIKRNFFEVFVGKAPMLGEVLNWMNWACIEFGELAGEIVGYKMSVPYYSRNYFSMETHNFRHNSAIWVPEAVAAMRQKSQSSSFGFSLVKHRNG